MSHKTLILAFMIITALTSWSNRVQAETTSPTTAGHAESGPKILKGKIVDITCWLTHNSEGEAHKDCARECALKGLPFGILAEDGLIYQIVPLGHTEPKEAYVQILDYLEQTVTITGNVFIKNGMRLVMIDKIAKL